MGDPACFMDRVCDDCGRLVGDGPEAEEHAPGCPSAAPDEEPDGEGGLEHQRRI